MSRVLATGAAGFVGRPAAAALVRRGWEVHAVSRRPRLPADAVVWHRGDLLAAGDVRELIGRVRPTHLLHLAWDVSPGYWSSGANVRWLNASLELVGGFAAAGGRRAVLAGTCAEYDWAHVQDVGEAFAALVDAELTGPVNIASGVAASVADVARLVGSAAGDGSLVKLGALPDRLGDPPELTADVRRLREELDFAPRYTLATGIADPVRWWQSESASSPSAGSSP